MSARVAAVVPARNEAARIADTVRALRAIPAIDEVIVVDDGSSDGTTDAARAAGARVVRIEHGRGKGNALSLGIDETDAEVLLFIDGDLGASARVAEDLLAPVLDGRADMTIAIPPPSRASGFGLVERFARWGIRRLTGIDTARPLSGQRAVRRGILGALAPRFGVEVGLTIDAARGGARIVEVPAAVEHERTGRDLRGFLHRARQGADVLGALAVRVPRRRAAPVGRNPR